MYSSPLKHTDMRTEEILNEIRANGRFNNWRGWSVKDVALWVRCNYNCSRYIANKVAKQIM